MSGAALAIGRRGTGSSAALELALFAALAVFGLAQWSRLVNPAPLADLGLALVCACLGAVALTAIGHSGWGRRRLLAAAAAAAFLTVVAAAVAAGLPARLVLPGNWDELGANLSDGLAGIEDTELPYGGSDAWLRLTLILAAVVLLTMAVVLAFWPTRGRVGPRVLALTPLVAIYTVAVTLDAPDAELLWGIPLLLLAVAWLWLPELPGRRWGVVLAIVVGAGVVAVPVAARVETERPWLDYESWDWFAGEQSVTYDWNHSYGPLDWPQEGTTLLEAESQQPLYWKTSVLDRFDGFTWQRADESDPIADAEVSARGADYSSAPELADRNPEWRFEADFRVGDLRSGLVVGAGTPLSVEGIDGAVPTGDGTVLAFDDALDSGDAYSIDTYAPQPSVRRMQRAPQHYPEAQFASTTLVGLPARTRGLTSGFAPAAAIPMPLWGEPAGAEEARILRSPYAPLYGLARRLTATSLTVYDAVRTVESHLQSAYNYTPNVDEETFPLAAFLEQGDGYCQQFSGTMALTLRMVGIPSRVVSGFAPGRLDASRGVYSVRDLDAHSWVEVYFRGIGWVTFDPTPAAAPASAQALEEGGPLRLPRDAAGSTPDGGPVRSLDPELSGGAVPAPSPGDSGSPGALALATLAIIAAVGLLGTVTVTRRRRRLAAGELADSQVREFVGALSRLGWDIPRQATLFALERRFGDAGRTAIADYAEALRRHRYGAGHPRPPGPEARRRLREAVGARGGLRRRLRALRAIPPGGPAR